MSVPHGARNSEMVVTGTRDHPDEATLDEGEEGPRGEDAVNVVTMRRDPAALVACRKEDAPSGGEEKSQRCHG